MGTVDICIGNNLIIDFDIFSLWVDGFTSLKKIIIKINLKNFFFS